MEGQEHKETKRDRVRRILITPLVQAGMRRQTKMKAPDCEAMLVRLADKLAHMSDANLRGLVALFTRHARGPERNQWPDEVSMVSWALAIQPPPPRANPYVVSVLQSEAGRRAEAGGYLTELYIHATRFGPPYKASSVALVLKEAEKNRRELEQVRAAVARGTATQERRQWLEWYDRHARQAQAIRTSLEGKAA